MSNLVYLSLGSNLGKREDYLQLGINLLSEHHEITITKVSSIYETEPVGLVNQPSFLNIAVEIQTTLSPIELLRICQGIEGKAQRKQSIRWGPRTLDLDILLYNQENIKMDELCVPHPRMMERSFVLVPLLEIQPHIIVPQVNKRIEVILEDLNDKEGVKLWKQRSGVGEFEHLES